MSANEQREALKLISHLLEDPYNQICADCQCKPSKWASTTLGVFICIDCSGVHRSLGTHISFVRSCTLDSWTMEQARLMEAIGNRLGNSYWESKLPMDYERPGNSNRSLMQNFIKEKYQLKRYADDGPPPHIVYKHLLMKQMASSSISSSHGKRSRSEKHHSRSMKNSQSYDNTKNFDDKHKDLQFSRPQNQTPPAQEAPPPQIEHESLDSFFAEQPKRSIPKPYIPHKKVVYEMPKEEPDYENMRPDEIDSFFNTESIENAMLSKMQNMFAGKIGGNNDQEPEQEVEYDAFGEIAEPNTAKLESFFDGKPSPQQNSTTSPQKLQNHSSLVITNISTAQIPQNQQNCDLNDNNENDITNENFDQNIEENDEENPENECFEEEEEINNVNEPLTNEPNQIEIPQKIENHLNDELITEQQVEAPVFPTLGDIKITLDIPNEDNSMNAAANDDDGFWDDVANDENEDDGFFELPPKTNLPEPIKLEGKSIQPTTDLLNQVQPTAIQEDKLFDLSLSQNAPLPNLEQNEYVSMDNNTEANITRNEYDTFKEKQNVNNNHLLDDYNSMNNNDVNLIENSNPPQAQFDIDTSLLDTTNPFEQTENENSNNLENILNNASTKTNNDTFEINFECDNKNNDQVYENKENEINKQNSSQELIPENLIEDNSNLPNNDNDKMIETNRNNSLDISAQSSNVEPNAITQINDNNHNVDFHEEPVEKIVVREPSQKKVIRLSINMVNAIDLTEPELKPRKAETIEEQIIDDFFAEAEQTLSQKPKPNIHSRSHHSRPTNTNPSNPTTTNVSNEPMEENTNKSRRRHHRDDDEYEDFFQPKQRTKSQTPPDVAVSRTQKSAFAPPPARKPGAHLPARLQKKIEPVVEESSRRRRHHHSKK